MEVWEIDLHEIKWQMFGKRTSALSADMKHTNTHTDTNPNSTQRKNWTQRASEQERERESLKMLHVLCSKICHLKISIVDLHPKPLASFDSRTETKTKKKNRNIINAKSALRMCFCVLRKVWRRRGFVSSDIEEDLRYSNFVRIFSLSSAVSYVVDEMSLARSSVRLFTFIDFFFASAFVQTEFTHRS